MNNPTSPEGGTNEVVKPIPTIEEIRQKGEELKRLLQLAQDKKDAQLNEGAESLETLREEERSLREKLALAEETLNFYTETIERNKIAGIELEGGEAEQGLAEARGLVEGISEQLEVVLKRQSVLAGTKEVMGKVVEKAEAEGAKRGEEAEMQVRVEKLVSDAHQLREDITAFVKEFRALYQAARTKEKEIQQNERTFRDMLQTLEDEVWSSNGIRLGLQSAYTGATSAEEFISKIEQKRKEVGFTKFKAKKAIDGLLDSRQAIDKNFSDRQEYLRLNNDAEEYRNKIKDLALRYGATKSYGYKQRDRDADRLVSTILDSDEAQVAIYGEKGSWIRDEIRRGAYS